MTGQSFDPFLIFIVFSSFRAFVICMSLAGWGQGFGVGQTASIPWSESRRIHVETTDAGYWSAAAGGGLLSSAMRKRAERSFNFNLCRICGPPTHVRM
jgi:hypothetical protein